MNHSFVVSQAAVGCDGGGLDILNRLLEDPRVVPTVPALLVCIDRGNLDALDRLLKDHRADPSAFENLALAWAIQCNEFEIVNRLLEDRRVVNKRGRGL